MFLQVGTLHAKSCTPRRKTPPTVRKPHRIKRQKITSWGVLTKDLILTLLGNLPLAVPLSDDGANLSLERRHPLAGQLEVGLSLAHPGLEVRLLLAGDTGSGLSIGARRHHCLLRRGQSFLTTLSA